VKCAAATSSRLAYQRTPQHLRQLGEVYSDPPRLVSGEQVGRRASARLLLEVKIAERLPVLVADDEALWMLIDGPRRREAARLVLA
jgi:hypothetical protein